MILVKKHGPFEVFSRGVEEPWVVHKDGAPFKQVWTWPEVETILRGEATTQTTPTIGLKAREIRTMLKSRGYRVKASRAYSGVRGGWEAVAVHRDLPVLSTVGHVSQIDALRALLAKAG